MWWLDLVCWLIWLILEIGFKAWNTDCFCNLIRPGSVLFLMMKLVSLECFGCNLGVGTIVGKCFRLEISKNGQKRRYRVNFELTKWLLFNQWICHYSGSPWTSPTPLELTWVVSISVGSVRSKTRFRPFCGKSVFVKVSWHFNNIYVNIWCWINMLMWNMNKLFILDVE